MAETDKLYRMDERWIHQPWFDQNSVFKLVKITENRIRQFGVDCIWENIITGYKSNYCDNIMRQLTNQELREFKLTLIIQD